MRFIHWIWSVVMGEFWRPCPVCHHFFAAHEASRKVYLAKWWDEMGSGTDQCICRHPDCEAEATRRNAAMEQAYKSRSVTIRA